MDPLFSVIGWMASVFFAILVLPWVLETIPAIFDFIKNVVLWLIWVIKYRNKKS
jgi:hypothetical protein